MICRHCQKSKANRPRGLCWDCYYRPGVREQYPSTSKYARRGIANGHLAYAPVPAKPTGACPGSAEKLAELGRRALRGESLWHPLDSLGASRE